MAAQKLQLPKKTCALDLLSKSYLEVARSLSQFPPQERMNEILKESGAGIRMIVLLLDNHSTTFTVLSRRSGDEDD